MSKLFSYLKTPTFGKNALIALGVVIAFFLVIFYSLNIYTRHGEGIPVPQLKGLPVEKAIEILESKGFRYQVDSVYVTDKSPGEVIEQDPDPNTNVKINRTVYLTIITRIAPDVKFPDINGKTFLEAKAILNNYGLKVGDTTYISDVARDVVLQTKFGNSPINLNQQLPKGSKIDLVLGDGMGASEVDIPNLTGLTLSEARLSLLGSSLKLGIVTYSGTIIDTALAKIIKQMPAPSDTLSKVSIGTPVDITIGTEN